MIPPAKLAKAGTAVLGKTWTVSFDGAGAPDGSLKVTGLSSLTESSDPAVKYFSGTATYKNTFKVKGKAAGIACWYTGPTPWRKHGDSFYSGSYVEASYD